MARDTVTQFGEEPLEEWITNNKILILVSHWHTPSLTMGKQLDEGEDGDPSENEDLFVETLLYYTNELPSAHFLFVVDSHRVSNLLKILTQIIKVCTLHVKIRDNLCITGLTNFVNEKFMSWMKSNQWRSNLCVTAHSRRHFFRWLQNDSSLYCCESMGQIIWKIIQQQILKFNDLHGVSSIASAEMLDCLSFIAYKVMCEDTFDAKYVPNIYYTENTFRNFLYSILMVRQSFLPCCYQHLMFPHQSVQQILVAWYIFKNQKPLLTTISSMRHGDGVATMFAGHLRREVKNLDPRTLKLNLKNLFLRSEKSKMPHDYLIYLINELLSDPSLIDQMFTNAVFARQFQVFETSLLAQSLNYYIKYIEARKVLLIVRYGRDCTSIVNLTNSILRLDIGVGLVMMNHLEWNSPYNSDSLLSMALSPSSRLRVEDFFGHLTLSSMKKLTSISVPYLTCLRLRLTSKETVFEIINVQHRLPRLLWFEIDFDIPLSEIFSLQLNSIITAPLCDLSFRDLDDTHVQPLVDFLCMLRPNYLSGLHCHFTRISACCVTELLTIIKEHNLILSTPIDVVARYRSWKYPEMAVLQKYEMEDDDKVIHLLGFDDRSQYSDNEIHSDALVSPQDMKRVMDVLNDDSGIQGFKCGFVNVMIKKSPPGVVHLTELIPNGLTSVQK